MTIQMPFAKRPTARAPALCSSHEAPRYVGSFALPEVTRQDWNAPPERIRPGIPAIGGHDGRYMNNAFWSLSLAELPKFRRCTNVDGDGCFGLMISGSRDVTKGPYLPRPIPDRLVHARPAPEVLDRENHWAADDLYLDLDGAPVAHAVGDPGMSDGQYVCRFRLQHPEGGFIVGVGLDCAEIDDWRALLRGVLGEISDRTLSAETRGAACDVPPAMARIADHASGHLLEEVQAMHDWAVAWEAR